MDIYGKRDRYEANGKLILTLKDGDYSSQSIKNFSKVTDITIVKRGPGGVADELVIATDKGTYKIISEYNIRAVLCDGVNTKLIDGRQCLVIELDGNIEVNGIAVRAAGSGDSEESEE